jgi:hypothetical protein
MLTLDDIELTQVDLPYAWLMWFDFGLEQLLKSPRHDEYDPYDELGGEGS